MPLSNALLSITLFALGGHSAPHLPPLTETSCPSLDRLVVGALERIVRPEPPLVLLREKSDVLTDPTGEILSFDRPDYWAPVPYGALTVEVRLPGDAVAAGPVEQVVVLLDGHPLNNNRYLIGPVFPAAPLDDDGLLLTYRFELPCPSPGKHLIQARYKRNGVWSRLSAPLRFDVRFPERPEIVSLFNANDVGGIVRPHGLIRVTGAQVRIRLAKVKPKDKVIAYLDGKSIADGQLNNNCCLDISVANHVPPGIYALTVRVVPEGAPCELASDPSEPVNIHYYDEDVYLLKPGPADQRIRPSEAKPADQKTPQSPASEPAPPETLEPGQETEDPADDDVDADALNALVTEPHQPKADATASFPAQEADRGTQKSTAEKAAELTLTQAQRVTTESELTTVNAAAVPSGASADSVEDAELPAPEKPDAPRRTFYFSSIAHFPIRGFGLRGEVHEGEGAIIYEDMAFSFNNNGDYEAHFLLETPDTPVTLRLQMRVQAYEGGPWFTVTLPPRSFPASPSGSRARHPQTIAGHSEVLKRSFPDVNNVRRSGTARFGYGFDALRTPGSNQPY